jgi:hypothetical protein
MTKAKLKKTLVLIFAFAALSAAVAVIYIIETEKAQFQRHAQLVDYTPAVSSDSKVLVVYFSRSGSTELMAMEIAKRYQASLVQLQAEDYRIGFIGWLNALKDSQTQRATITPQRDAGKSHWLQGK